MTTGYSVAGGLRSRLCWHESTRGGGIIALWVTGGRYTIEAEGRSAPAGSTESAARSAFERAVEMHYECPECGEHTPRAWHTCAARI